MTEPDLLTIPSQPMDVTTGGAADGKARTGMALCLSGGGYRAALFHLGVLRCLHDMGILQTVDTISSVSGGSILSAYLAKRLFELNITSGISFADWEAHMSSGFRAFVRNDIRTTPFLTHLLWNWLMPKWRARHLQRNYAKYLLKITENGSPRQMTLADVASRPEFIFCSTDVSFGINWEFKRDKVGDYHVGYSKKPEWPLALAVAASSSFPPVFGPMRIGLNPADFKGGAYRGKDRDDCVRRLKLSDGGVYDNFGLEPVDNLAATILVSDGGSPFGYQGAANPLQRVMRYLSVMMNQVASLRTRMFFTGVTKKWHTGVLIRIGRERTTKAAAAATQFDGYVDKEVRSMIAGIRTDLDRFTDAEARILENHGYFETFRRINANLPGLISNPGFNGITPHPDWVDESKVRKALEQSSKRLVLSRLLG